MSLIEKIRKARESVIEVEGHKYTIRRPTEADQAEMYRGAGYSRLDLVRSCVVDWDLQEIDVVPGGSPIPLTFSAALWAEYVDDKSSLWQPISDAVRNLINTHNEEVERSVKK
jgi:hypothetical protein